MQKTVLDGNSATTHIAYAFCETAFIYPITPSSPMSELADIWSANGKKNVFDAQPTVIQMQSESGVSGALHGALTCGALSTTFTCSQGLLLMIPDMYKIAGELLPTVIHASARALSTHALSIFGDHQDVMACRQTGFAMLCSASVQETMDLALVAHIATLESSVPFLHFFDGFRTSHEATDIQVIDYDTIKTLIPTKAIRRFKDRALTPDNPTQRGTAQNADIYFQNREACNPYYQKVPSIVQKTMDNLAQLTGRSYRIFDYFGSPDAEQIVVMMGSGAYAMKETVEMLNSKGEKFGVIFVRLYRPFDGESFIATLPPSCKKICVLDRTKEAGSVGEPLYTDICAVLQEHGKNIRVVGGRYGVGQKEFNPTCCLAVLDNLRSATPKNHFTVGIDDDISHTSLAISKKLSLEYPDRFSCKFYGLGSDGTVGANKNSVKIIGENTDLFTQAYFFYDSRKSGGVTISHLRLAKTPIGSPYLIDDPNFVACHNPSYLERYDILEGIKENGVFLLNCPWTELSDLESHLPNSIKRKIAEKHLDFFVIDATKIAEKVGLKGRTSTVMQTAFFFVSPFIMPFETAKEKLKAELKSKFMKKGEAVVNMNLQSVDETQNAVKKIDYPKSWLSAKQQAQSPSKTEYYDKFISPILKLNGDKLPVSAFSPDGSVPTNTTKLEKHGTAQLLPEWISENCIQCNQCAFVCPHATIRPFVFSDETATPNDCVSLKAVGMQNAKFRIQVSPYDCMGCGVCANECPAKEKALVMRPAVDIFTRESGNWDFLQSVSQLSTPFKPTTVKGSQFKKPLFEFSYACAGCGETPYIRLLTQLFGERLIIANATGCSSIYGGSAPTCPYAKNVDGKGPAWASSLFEDNAEFALGMKIATDLAQKNTDKSVWAIGGDGWAYDIGFGGLDHVLSLGKKMKILVLDSEVYSNTGGQTSKATPLGATARFSMLGKRRKKKNLALMAMTYGDVYVASVAMGANKQQLINALTEAENYDGTALVIAYSPCISHGVNMSKCMDEERFAVDSGYWNLFRYNPDLKKQGKTPFVLDSGEPSVSLRDFYLRENRFVALKNADEKAFEDIIKQAEEENKNRLNFYKKLADLL